VWRAGMLRLSDFTKFKQIKPAEFHQISQNL